MGKIGKIILIILCLFTSVPQWTVNAKTTDMITVVDRKTTRKKPYLTKKSLSMTTGSIAYNKPVTNGKVRYYSSNSKVVKVNQKTGKLQARKKGKVTIRVKCYKTKKYYAKTLKFTVTVKARPQHVHDWHTDVSVPVTCTTDGLTRMSCACGLKRETIIPATGHLRLFGDYGFQQPTCTQDGYQIEMCRDCMQKVTTVLKATGHVYRDVLIKEAWDEITDSYDVTICKICNAEFKGGTQLKDCTAHGLALHGDDPEGFAYTTKTIDVKIHHDPIYSYQCVICAEKP